MAHGDRWKRPAGVAVMSRNVCAAYEADHNLSLAIANDEHVVKIGGTLSHGRDRLKDLKK
jgi:hypothetical protein